MILKTMQSCFIFLYKNYKYNVATKIYIFFYKLLHIYVLIIKSCFGNKLKVLTLICS